MHKIRNAVCVVRSSRTTAAMVLAVVCLAALPGAAFAEPWDDSAKGVYDLIMSIVRWVAVICVVAAGIMALAGKLSWDWAVKIIIGLVLIFGATQLVDYFRGAMGG